MRTTAQEKQFVVVRSSGKTTRKLPRAKHVIPCRQFRALASQLLTLRENAELHKAIGIASCSRNQGNTTAASNIAVAINDAIDGEVLLVDCVETTKTYVKRRHSHGWFDLVFGDVDVVDVIQATDRPKLSVISSGLPVSQFGGTYNRDRLANLVQQLKKRFEFVIFDLPSAEEVTGCMPIASVLDGVLLNVRSCYLNSSQAKRVQNEFQSQGANVVGVVLSQPLTFVPQFLRTFLGMPETIV